MKKVFFTLLALALPLLVSATSYTDNTTGIIYDLTGKGSMKVAKVTGATDALKATRVLNIPSTVSDGTYTYTVTTICGGALTIGMEKIYVADADIEWKDGKPYYNGYYLSSEPGPDRYYYYNPSDPGAMIFIEADDPNITWTDAMPYYNGNQLYSTPGATRYYYSDYPKWTEVSLPATITTLEEGAAMMGGVVTLKVPNLESWFNIICSGNPYIAPEHFYVNGSEVTDITIPSTITSISKYLFYGFKSLNSVAIPGTVQNIGEHAFESSSISSLTLSEGITTIGDYAFSYCPNLVSVTIPSTCGNALRIFTSCENLTTATINSTWAPYGGFSNCGKLTSVTFGPGVTNIENEAFSNSGLESIVIPNSITRISMEAFQNCSKLKNVTIYREEDEKGIISWMEISNRAFVNCPALEDFYCYAPLSAMSAQSDIFDGSEVNYGATLHVPASDVTAYQTTYPWSQFTTVKALSGTTPPTPAVVPDDITATIESLGWATLYSEYALDFSGVTGLKAYIVSAFTPANNHVILTQVTNVPANTGVVLVGSAGNYTIPTTTTQTYVANLMKGVKDDTMMWSSDGTNKNYILANGTKGVGFYVIEDGTTLKAGKAYLAIPNTSSAAPQFVPMDIEGTITGIKNIDADVTGKAVFNLSGQRQSGLKNGINIVGSKKIVVK